MDINHGVPKTGAMSSDAATPYPNTYALDRFVTAQESIFDTALAELRRGQKRSHWMWFIFPQLDGLGSSAMARRYGIKSLEEAEAYLKHPDLGPRLIQCCQAILAVHGKSAWEILGSPDDLKLKSSMTLFSLAPGAPAEFKQVLHKYYGGQMDGRTLELLKQV